MRTMDKEVQFANHTKYVEIMYNLLYKQTFIFSSIMWMIKCTLKAIEYAGKD